MHHKRDEYERSFVEGMGRALRPAGFRKSGAKTFVRVLEEVTHVVQAQSSSSSTKDHLRVTVNVGLSSKAVAEELGAKGYPPRVEIDCHARSRISSFLKNHKEDKWWDISDEVGAATAAAEVEDAICRSVLPVLDEQRDGASVLATWQLPIARPPFPFGGQEHWNFLIESLGAGLNC